MFKKCNRGFTMVEMLLSVSVWFLLCATLLPQLMLIMTERRNTEIFNNGNQLLSEELQKAYNGDILLLNDTVERDGVTYRFSNLFNDELEKWELCISWEDKLSKSIERCGYIHGEK